MSKFKLIFHPDCQDDKRIVDSVVDGSQLQERLSFYEFAGLIVVDVVPEPYVPSRLHYVEDLISILVYGREKFRDTDFVHVFNGAIKNFSYIAKRL